MGVKEIDQIVRNRSDLSADILHSAGYRVASIGYIGLLFIIIKFNGI